MSYKYTRGGTYKSRNTEEIDNLRQKYLDRGDFSFNYDPNTDSAYQDYAKMMRTQGSLAMEDAMGKAAASTGGYGNSYAQTIGQQTYQNYANDISAAQSTFEDRAYDRALAKFNSEENSILSKMGMLEDRESADKAAWEEDYLNDYNKAVASGSTADVAEVLGMSEEDYLASLAAGKTPLGDEQIAGYINAVLNGDDPMGKYYGMLKNNGYNVENLINDANAYALANDLGFKLTGTEQDVTGADGKTTKQTVYNPQYGGNYNADINSRIAHLKNTNEGENFEVIMHKDKHGSADNLDVQIGTSVDKDSNKAVYNIAKNAGKGLMEYKDQIYYYDGNTVYTVKPVGWGKDDEYDELLKLLKGE